MRITTSSIFVMWLFFSGIMSVHAQEKSSFLPNPFEDLMQKLSASGTLEGLIYADFNANGTRDAEEPGLEAIRVIIVNSNGNGQTTLTNTDGIWSTQVLEGSTNVLVDFTSLPAGYRQTEGTDPNTEVVIVNDTVQAQTKGFTFEGQATGHLYFDENGNGNQDTLELNMPDVDVLVTDPYGNTQTLTTNAEGDWEATVLFGDIEVAVDENDPNFPAGAFQTEGSNPSTHLIPHGQETFTEDDGFFVPDPDLEGTLQGHLYRDINGNGTQESTEPDLPNIDVQITDAFGNISIVSTNASGDWSIVVPSGNTLSDILENDPDFPVGAIQTEGSDPTTTFVPVDVSLLSDNDGFFFNDPNLFGILTGHLYFDNNANGTQDAGEPDMPNVDVEIIDAFGEVTILETDANGDWSIEVPAGSTFSNIDEDDPDFPSGATQTEGTDPSLTFVVANETTLSDNDGFFVPDPDLEGTLLGHLYFDVNGNGTQDIGEPDMPDVDVEITDAFDNSITVSTDTDGDWSLTVPAGESSSEIVRSDPDFPTGAVQTEGTDPTTTFVPANATILSDNDGFFVPDPDITGTLTGHLYLDENANGNQDSGEPDIEGVELLITDVFGETTTTVTNADGNWAIEVPAGTTISDINQQGPNFPVGAIQIEGTDPTTTFVVVGSTTFSEDDGFFVPDPDITGTLIGHLYFDDNGNGFQDVGEPDMPNVDVEIIDAFSNLFLLETDVNGDWEIEVPAGNTFSNIVEQDSDFPVGAVQTEGTDPSLTVVVVDAITLSDNDGFFIQDPSITGTLSGHLYFDNNQNASQDTDEPDMPNVTVEIVDGDGITQSVVTDASGDWSTTVVAGEVVSTIDEADPDFPQGAIQTEGDNPTTTQVIAGQDFVEDPDGFFTDNQSGTLSGIVYEDLNNNSIQDDEEPGIANVDVQIEEFDGNVQTIVTNANGQWSATVTTGLTTSTIDESDPDFPQGAIQTQGTNPTSLFVGSNASANETPDGFFLEETTGTLTGRLYFDDNANNSQDPDEQGIANVTILITDAEGVALETQTNNDGDWFIEVTEGETISKIDEEDNDFPNFVTQTEGTDPTTSTVVAGETTFSDNDGFVIDDIEIFNAVGSEGNQTNDIFRLRGIENFPSNNVQIFNRQGVEVYNTQGYDNETNRFDGFSDGDITIQKDKRLPPGTYFYILNYINRNGELVRRTGYLHLN